MKILFLAYAGKHGLGHYYRTLALAQEASSRGHFSVFLSDRPTMVPGVYSKKVRTWEYYDFMATLIIVQPDWVVADLPNSEPPGWLWTNYPTYKLCLIDGNPNYCNLAIGQGFGGLDYEAPEYIIIPPELQAIRRPQQLENCWFVWGGAGDTKRLLSAFSRYMSDDSALLLGVAGITPTPNPLRGDIHYFKTAQNRSEFFEDAAVCYKACVQMGQIVWELLYLGLSCYVFSHSERNLKTARKLAARGWVLARDKVGVPRAKYFQEFLSTPFVLQERPVDGQGARRIVELLETKCL